jgi:hypothetical protein
MEVDAGVFVELFERAELFFVDARKFMKREENGVKSHRGDRKEGARVIVGIIERKQLNDIHPDALAPIDHGKEIKKFADAAAIFAMQSRKGKVDPVVVTNADPFPGRVDVRFCELRF